MQVIPDKHGNYSAMFGPYERNRKTPSLPRSPSLLVEHLDPRRFALGT